MIAEPVATRCAPMILIAEDDRDTREALSVRLEASGYEVSCVGRGSDVIPSARKAEPDLIVLDLGLPDCNGMDVLDLLKETWETHRVPIVVLSARDAATHEPAVLKAGAQVFLEKPSNSREFMDVIESFL